MRFVFYLIVIGCFVVFAFLFNEYQNIKHKVYTLTSGNANLSTQIFDRNNDLIANIFRGEHRLHASYDEIPPKLIEALIATEDTAFFEHIGINPEAIFRAAIKDIKARKFVEGASTITQQLVRNVLLSNEKKIMRKIKEALLAIAIEQELSKEEILEMYLNKIFLGHGYHGIKTASLGYFHKQLDELSYKEIAMLVSIPKSPSYYNPVRNIDKSLSLANGVLYRMHYLGWITDDEYEKNIKEIPKVYRSTLTRNKAPYIVDEVIKQLRYKYRDLFTGGYKIYLNIDLKTQIMAKETLLKGHANLLKKYKDANGTNAALIAIEPSTGEVVALVGGINYKKSSFNRATQSKRQPGSSFKPFIYQIALDEGYGQNTMLTDVSRIYNNSAKGKLWKPKNYENNFEGLIQLKEALVHSRNLATINLVNEIGIGKVYRTLRKKYLFPKLPFDLSLSLGSFSISLLDFSKYYTMFSNYGVMSEPYLIKRIENRLAQKKIYEPIHTKILEKKQAYLMIDILKNVVSRGTGKRARVKGLEVAGKTGTTNNSVDTLFAGFTPDIQVIVWYGRDNNTKIAKKATGGSVAAPVVGDFISKYLLTHPEMQRSFKKPRGVSSTTVKGKKIYYTNISQLDTSSKDEGDINDELIF